ncbi:MAG: amidohydrolase [Candidatus Binatia bacterium]|nr:amidohydrolase [Candidatus Binatia bacterium]
MSLVIDADGHFMEPFDLWEQYLEPQYRARAIRAVNDPATGEETVLIAGRRSRVMTDPSLLKLTVGAGQLERMADPTFTYRDGPPAAYDAHARVKLMDQQGIDKALVYPTLGLVWGSDFPHAEGYANPIVELREAIEELPASTQHKILGENAARLYNLHEIRLTS